jgi:hypothetical protein
MILAELVKRGHVVLTPFGANHRYDLVLDCGDRFLRVQCKTGRLRGGVILFPTRSTQSNTLRVRWRDYRGDIDVFIVFCPDTGGFYAVPVEEAASGGSLRLTPPKNGQTHHVRWAADYELPTQSPAIAPPE